LRHVELVQACGAPRLFVRLDDEGREVARDRYLLREAAGLATQIQGETIPTDKPGTLSMTVRMPAGVVFSMAPWNGAGVLAARAIAYPLV